MFRTTTMIRAPPVCALTAQIASICISNVELQQFFARNSRPNSFATPNFTAETFVEPDARLCLNLSLNGRSLFSSDTTLAPGVGKHEVGVSRPE